MIQIVYFAIPNHTEHTLSENVAVIVGVNKHLKCNLGLVCEFPMLVLPPKKWGVGAIALGLKQQEMGADALPLFNGIWGSGSQSLTTVTSQIVVIDSGSGKIRTRANFKPLTPCSDSTMPV